MYRKLISVLVGAMLFSSAQAEITISPTMTKVDPVEFRGSERVLEAGDRQITSLTPSALLLLSAGLFGIIAVARRESA